MDPLESFLRVLGKGRKNPGFHVLSSGARKLSMEQRRLAFCPRLPVPPAQASGIRQPTASLCGLLVIRHLLLPS